VVSRQAAEIGAGGYVNKADLDEILLPAVECVVADRSGEKTESVRATTDTQIDVSERALARRAGDLLAAIVDSSDDAIISKTLDGVITSWNKSAERMFGYTREEAVGQHITLIIPEDRRDEEAKIVERLRRGERVDHSRLSACRKDGTLLELSLTISPVKDAEGRVVGASKVARASRNKSRLRKRWRNGRGCST